MSCRARRDTILLYAADALEEDERRELVAHLETGCAVCSAACVEARETLALLALSLDRVAPPEGARDRLLGRVAAGAAAPGRADGARRRVALAAGIGLLLGAGLAAALAWRLAVAPLSAKSGAAEDALAAATAELAELRAALAEGDAEMHALEEEARIAAEQVRLLRAPRLEVMTLAAAGSAAGASGRIFWKLDDYACYFHAEQLPALAPGRTYVLWVVSARDELFAAASFAPGPQGEVGLLTQLPKEFPPVVRTLVTDEPREYGKAPTGAVHLLGTVTKAGRS
jgi:Anti-sigma-K factor rskA, C-terminal